MDELAAADGDGDGELDSDGEPEVLAATDGEPEVLAATDGDGDALAVAMAVALVDAEDVAVTLGDDGVGSSDADALAVGAALGETLPETVAESAARGEELTDADAVALLAAALAAALCEALADCDALAAGVGEAPEPLASVHVLLRDVPLASVLQEYVKSATTQPGEKEMTISCAHGSGTVALKE